MSDQDDLLNVLKKKLFEKKMEFLKTQILVDVIKKIDQQDECQPHTISENIKKSLNQFWFLDISNCALNDIVLSKPKTPNSKLDENDLSILKKHVLEHIDSHHTSIMAILGPENGQSSKIFDLAGVREQFCSLQEKRCEMEKKLLDLQKNQCNLLERGIQIKCGSDLANEFSLILLDTELTERRAQALCEILEHDIVYRFDAAKSYEEMTTYLKTINQKNQ